MDFDHAFISQSLFGNNTPTPPGSPVRHVRRPRNPMASAIDFSGLTADETDALIRAPVVSNSVAPGTVVTAVQAVMSGKGVTDADAPHFWLRFILACADQGSSSQVVLLGTSRGVSFSLAATEIRKLCTLRQFCMYFAKVAFDAMVRANRPPANWLRRGHSSETRFSAFDFFNGVTNDASPDPPRGMIRLPTLEEIRAHNANMTLAIQSSRRDRVLTTNGMVGIQQQGVGGFQRPALGWGS